MKSTQEYIDLLKQYKENHAQSYGIKKMGIFGSVANGKQKEESDLDVCVEITRPDIYTLLNIKYDLEELCQCKVDIIRIRENMNPLLKYNIEKEGIYV